VTVPTIAAAARCSSGLEAAPRAVATVVAPLLFLQGFGLGGVIATFGLILDLVGFLLLLVFILVSSSIMLRREGTAGS
jgi:hypothetical protein